MEEKDCHYILQIIQVHLLETALQRAKNEVYQLNLQQKKKWKIMKMLFEYLGTAPPFGSSEYHFDIFVQTRKPTRSYNQKSQKKKVVAKNG